MRLTVTVAVTNYNHGTYISQAIRSILNQTRQADRILVVDDGSTDDSEAAYQKMPSSVEIIRQANTGIVGVRNRVIKELTTSHILFLDADNYLMPFCLRWATSAWRLPHTSKLAVVYSPSGNEGPEGGRGYLHSRPWDPNSLAAENYIDNTALFSTEALLDVGGYSVRYAEIGQEDWDLMLKLVERGWYGRMVPRALFVYRSLPGGRNSISQADGGIALRKLIREDHPWTIHTRPLRRTRLVRKLTNPLQTMARAWDERM